MSSFWKRWMMVWCWTVGLFGVVLAGAAFEATSAPMARLLELLGPVSSTFDAQLRFSLAVLGAVTLGWSLTLWVAIGAALQLGAAGGAVWRGVTLAVVAWYVVDSLLSAATGFALNVVPNTVFLAVFLVPLWRTGLLRRAPAAATA